MGQVRFGVTDHIALITLDHPEKRNSVDATMSAQLAEIWTEVAENDDIHVGIVTGEGEKAFCAGGYIPSYVENGVVGSEGSGQRTPLPKPWPLWKPLIAAIRGAAVGGGFGLALSCDLRVVAHDALLGPSGLKRGVVQGAQQTQRLVRLIGLSRALEVLMLSKYVDGDEAYRLGIAQRVTDSEAVLDAAYEWAEVIAGYSPWAVSTTKKLAYLGTDLPFQEALDWEEQLTVESYQTPAAAEGFGAFVERRPASFGRNES